MKHKIAALCLFSLLAGLLVLAGTGLSFAGSPPKATGGVGFTAAGLERWVEFNAHEGDSGQPAKGKLHYKDANKDWYKADIQCVTVVDDRAFFSGPLLQTNRPDWEGLWVFIAVHDGGTPGSKGDHIWGSFFTSDPGCRPDNFNMFPVEKGNLVVH
jgi:hypothetical protein